MPSLNRKLYQGPRRVHTLIAAISNCNNNVLFSTNHKTAKCKVCLCFMNNATQPDFFFFAIKTRKIETVRKIVHF